MRQASSPVEAVELWMKQCHGGEPSGWLELGSPQQSRVLPSLSRQDNRPKTFKVHP